VRGCARIGNPEMSRDIELSTKDRLDVIELIARADNAATRRDTAYYVSLFTEDGVLDGEKGDHRGHAALSEAVDRVWAAEARRSHHLTLNVVIDDVTENRKSATATSALLVVDPGPPPALLSVSTIVQRLEKLPEGWRISRRTVN
jgi:SnoaL-like domain